MATSGRGCARYGRAGRLPSTGLLVGITTWLAFLWLGVNNAAVWGLAAGVLNGVPYLGPLMIVGAAALAGFLQSRVCPWRR